MKLSTTNIADALDALNLKGATYGIRPMWESAGKVAGKAVTVKIAAAGLTKSKNHLGVKAIEQAEAGDIVIIDNGGRLDTSCWGGILTNGAKMKGLSAVVVDGAVRDLDDSIEAGFPVYARGTVVATARGRIMEEATNIMIQFGGVQVRPGDDDGMGDRRWWSLSSPRKDCGGSRKGRAILCQGGADGRRHPGPACPCLRVDNKYNYEKMLK